MVQGPASEDSEVFINQLYNNYNDSCVSLWMSSNLMVGEVVFILVSSV